MQPGQEATPAGVTRTHCRVHLPAFHQYPCAQSLECLPVAHEDSAKALQTVPAMGPPPPPPSLTAISPALPHLHPLQISSLSASSLIPPSGSMPLLRPVGVPAQQWQGRQHLKFVRSGNSQAPNQGVLAVGSSLWLNKASRSFRCTLRTELSI